MPVGNEALTFTIVKISVRKTHASSGNIEHACNMNFHYNDSAK